MHAFFLYTHSYYTSLNTRILTLVPVLLLLVASCAKNGSDIPKSADSASATNQSNGTTAVGSADTVVPVPGARVPSPLTPPKPGDGGAQVITMLPDSDPAAVPPYPMAAAPKPDQNIPVGSMPIVQSGRLAELQPKIPGYRMSPKMSNKDVANITSRSSALFINMQDTTQTIRSTIIDQNERAADQILKDIAGLKKDGGQRVSVSPSGETLTAYMVEFNGATGVKCYIPSKHLATLELVIGDHRMLRLREENVTSADHLVEVAKRFNVKQFESMR
jgi:hypothetical protein